MKSKYLIKDPLPWLMEESDPSIRYLSLRDIKKDTLYEKEYGTIFNSGEVRKIFHNQNNILGDTKYFDLYYKGSMWYFAQAVENGLDKRTPQIENTAEFLFSECQDKSGGFFLNWKPPVPVACRTGNMIKYLILSGYGDDPRIKTGIEWILRHQRHDGGWLHCPLAGICDQFKLLLFHKAGKGLKRENDFSVTSCFYGTIASLWALLLYKEKDSAIEKSINDGIEFFLRRNLFKSEDTIPIKPNNNWNKDFRLLGYPVLSQYDILYGLLAVAKGGKLNDNRTGEAFNLIMSKQNDDGTWNYESAATGMMYGRMNRQLKGKPNKWVTLNCLRLMESI